MCYDAEFKLRNQLAKAILQGLPDKTIQDIKRELWTLTGEPYYEPDAELSSNVEEWPGLEEFDYYHVSGFSNPIVSVVKSVEPLDINLAHWSFIARGVKTEKDAYGYGSPGWMRNLNAMSENIYNPKSAFRSAAKYGRCVVQLDAYYEHHHYKSNRFPFRMKRKDGTPLYAAAIQRGTRLSDDEGNELKFNSMAILTCRANENSQMARIHNNPTMLKRGNGHRMLVLLEESQIEDYLKPYPVPPGEKGDPAEEKLFQEEILSLCKPMDDELLTWHSVINIKGRKASPYIGNIPEITEEYHWENLDYSQFE